MSLLRLIMLFDQLKTIIFTLGKPKKFPIYTRTWDPFCFLGYLSHRMDLFTYLPPFNTTTLIKPMMKRKRRPLGRARMSAGTVLLGRGTISV
jgi:hypothetical protein